MDRRGLFGGSWWGEQLERRTAVEHAQADPQRHDELVGVEHRDEPVAHSIVGEALRQTPDERHLAEREALWDRGEEVLSKPAVAVASALALVARTGERRGGYPLGLTAPASRSASSRAKLVLPRSGSATT